MRDKVLDYATFLPTKDTTGRIAIAWNNATLIRKTTFWGLFYLSVEFSSPKGPRDPHSFAYRSMGQMIVPLNISSEKNSMRVKASLLVRR